MAHGPPMPRTDFQTWPFQCKNTGLVTLKPFDPTAQALVADVAATA